MPSGVYGHKPLSIDARAKLSAVAAGNQWSRRHRRTVPVGSTYVATNGYVMVKTADDPSTWELEHRVVMAAAVGRPLLPTETVHHGPGGRADNRRENLTLSRSNRAPTRGPAGGIVSQVPSNDQGRGM